MNKSRIKIINDDKDSVKCENISFRLDTILREISKRFEFSGLITSNILWNDIKVFSARLRQSTNDEEERLQCEKSTNGKKK